MPPSLEAIDREPCPVRASRRARTLMTGAWRPNTGRPTMEVDDLVLSPEGAWMGF